MDIFTQKPTCVSDWIGNRCDYAMNQSDTHATTMGTSDSHITGTIPEDREPNPGERARTATLYITLK
jgi:hypothetical protein